MNSIPTAADEQYFNEGHLHRVREVHSDLVERIRRDHTMPLNDLLEAMDISGFSVADQVRRLEEAGFEIMFAPFLTASIVTGKDISIGQDLRAQVPHE